MGHPYRQRHENGDYDKQSETSTNAGNVKTTTSKTSTAKTSSKKA